MTLVEVLVALTIFGLIITGALQFVTAQNRAFREGIERVTALQAARGTMEFLETDLITLGTNLAPNQPGLVLATEDAIAFNADYASNVANDPFAVFYDPDAPDGQVSAALPSFTLASTGFTYPDTTYTVGGGSGAAELLLFYFAPDSSTARDDDYRLYRQVNSAEPEVVSENLLRSDDAPFFRYMRLTGSSIDSVADVELPLFHEVPIHLSQADSGMSAVVDSIRGVRVSLRGTNGRSGPNERTVEITRLISFRNADFEIRPTCGSRPILGVALGATRRQEGSGEWVVDLEWDPAVDEAGGENDVIRYVIWRRDPADADWGDPYLSVPAGQASYSYTDASVTEGESYEYGLAAQDCTPSLTSVSSSGSIAIP